MAKKRWAVTRLAHPGTANNIRKGLDTKKRVEVSRSFTSKKSAERWASSLWWIYKPKIRRKK